MLINHSVINSKVFKPSYKNMALYQARLNLSKLVEREALHLCKVLNISYEDSLHASEDYQTVKQGFNDAISLKKPVLVYRGNSTGCIYLEPYHNWAFRFWHDYLHVKHDLDFNYESELQVARMHLACVASHYGLGSLEYRLMQADTIGQVEFYRDNAGSFVDNQLQFALEYINYE